MNADILIGLLHSLVSLVLIDISASSNNMWRFMVNKGWLSKLDSYNFIRNKHDRVRYVMCRNKEFMIISLLKFNLIISILYLLTITQDRETLTLRVYMPGTMQVLF
jgi:hypothetical protein